MDANFVIMGLPASGKTTFLAALWHLVEADETDCRLKLGSYEGDLAYLNQISAAWRTFQPVPRTSQVGDVDVMIELVNRDTGVRASAFFPDLAGETFDAQVESRRCRSEFIESMAGDDGILLFISANVKGNGLSVVEFNAMMPADADGGPAAGPEQPTATGAGAKDATIAPPAGVFSDNSDTVSQPSAEWEPKLVPPQVRLVQLLSDLLRAPFEPRRRRLAVLISAWDLARGMGLTPRQWLANQMPLVSQFLLTNAPSFEIEVYGVSAQGVSLEDAEGVGEATQLTPSRRILIAGPQGEGHDLTSPLVWLMSAE